MKKATFYGLGLTTIFYLLLGCIGYAAFGNSAPGNILTGFGFYEPFWLVDMANICVIVHLIGAYQVKFLFFYFIIQVYQVRFLFYSSTYIGSTVAVILK